MEDAGRNYIDQAKDTQPDSPIIKHAFGSYLRIELRVNSKS